MEADAIEAFLALGRDVGIEAVKRYHRLSVTIDGDLPYEPTMIVGNHGFGGIFDLNVWAMLATLDELAPGRPITFLTHQLAWTLQVGSLIERLGARPASDQTALDSFAQGHHVVVFPGGDFEAAKSFGDRNKVMFGGRSGFARVAIAAGVPVVPVVTAGAGESALVLAQGKRLAKLLRADKLLRVSTLPVSVSIPWGLNVGVVGMLPYLPLPTKLDTRVLAAMRPAGVDTAGVAETPDDFAARVERTMQSTMDDLTRNRRLLFG
ncbi:MAG: 1-acyl-sn-glycerol-3-phosphate acyltransferase [Candidatus Nanopelagicales bacterium]